MIVNHPYRIMSLSCSDRYGGIIIEISKILNKQGVSTQDKMKPPQKEEHFDLYAEIIKKLRPMVVKEIHSLVKSSRQNMIYLDDYSDFDFGKIITNEKEVRIGSNDFKRVCVTNLFEIIVSIIKSKWAVDSQSIGLIELLFKNVSIKDFFDYNSSRTDLIFFPSLVFFEGYDSVLIDSDDISISEPILSFVGIKSPKVSLGKIVNNENIIVGLQLGETNWYLENRLLGKFEMFDKLKEEYNKWWMLIEHFSTLNPKDNPNQKTLETLQCEFKNSSFTQMLCSLKDWHYIDNYSLIRSEYEPLFEETRLINNIKEYNGMSYITPYVVSGSTLGIYNKNNIGTPRNNLEYWLSSNERSKVDHYPNKESYRPKQFDKVKTLQPLYSFYLMECFMEDYLEEVLRDLLKKKKIANYERNRIIYYGDVKDDKNKFEIDFLILTNSDKIVKIEAKRTLNKINIEKQKDKDEQIYAIDTYKMIDKYLLVGFTQDESCIKTYHNYMKTGKKGEIDYKITIPLYIKEDKNLICFAESDFAKMKDKLLGAIDEV